MFNIYYLVYVTQYYNIIMVIILISLQAIHLSYTDRFNQEQDILIEQKQPGLYFVIKNGVKIRQLFSHIVELKQGKMKQDVENQLLCSPIIVCLTTKKKKQCQQIIKNICQSFVNYIIQFKIDKEYYLQCPFNRAVLIDNQICYGEGCSQLRPKQQLRIALNSITKNIAKNQMIFIEKNQEEIKLLKKQGFKNIISQFDLQMFKQLFNNLSNKQQEINTFLQPQNIGNTKENQYGKEYNSKLLSIFKQVNLKEINKFPQNNLTIKYFIDQIYKPSNFYNIAAKSWVPFQSKQISAYLFYNISTSSVYIARSSKLKQTSYEQDTDKIIFGYYFSFIIDPEALAVPQDKHITLMRYSKIASFQSKKAIFNIRPYIQGLKVLSEIGFCEDELKMMFKSSFLQSKRINGLGSLILISMIYNQNLIIKSLCEKFSLVTYDANNSIVFINSLQQFSKCQTQISVCRTDFNNILDSSTYKEISTNILVIRKNITHIINIEELNQIYKKQIQQILKHFDSQKQNMLKSLIFFYKWKGSMLKYYDFIMYRITSLKSQIFQKSLNLSINFQQKIKLTKKTIDIIKVYPQIITLLIPQSYQYFIIPKQNIYSSSTQSLNSLDNSFFEQKVSQNPYLSFMNKNASFCIYNIQFSIFTFLQWTKATNRYDLIEYMSMLNNSFEDYLIMDKRLKLTSANEKKKILLVVDHIQLCGQIVDKPKSIKTVMIFRLKKINENEDMATITSEVRRKNSLEESQEEIIKILNKLCRQEGLFQNNYQLYDWILTIYMKAKCNIYGLNFAQAQKFLMTLHKDISTNSHRIKEIQQNHPTLWKYLYTFPIWKQNQKIVFNYKIFEFIQVKKLISSIQEGVWDCKLQTNQISSIIAMKHIFSYNMVANIVKRLIKTIQYLEDTNMILINYITPRNNCIQLIRSLTEPSTKQTNDNISHLHYQLFPQQKHIQIHDNIKHIAIFNEFFMVQTNDALEITNLQCSIRYKWVFANESRQTFHILSKFITKSMMHILLCKQDHEIWLYSIDLDKNNLLYAEKDAMNKIINEEDILRDILISQDQFLVKLNLKDIQKLISQKQNLQFSVQKTYFFEIIDHILLMAIKSSARIIVIAYDLSINQTFQMKVFQSTEYILDLRIINEEILYITNKTLNIIKMQKNLSINNHRCLQQFVIYLPNISYQVNSKVFVQALNRFISIVIISNYHINFYLIEKQTIIESYTINLKNKVQSAQYHQGLLFLFQSGDMNLNVFSLMNGILKKVSNYFLVQGESRNLYIYKNNILIEGRSYIKHLVLNNGKIMDIQ